MSRRRCRPKRPAKDELPVRGRSGAGRLITACWNLGRRARVDWRDTRRRHRELFAGRHRDVVDTTLLVGHLAYAGTGWLTNGDALLAATAAAQAREHARNNRD